jgi:rhomboid protease GluP
MELHGAGNPGAYFFNERPGGVAQPEIFPPGEPIPAPEYTRAGYGYQPPPEPRPVRRRSWASAPATYVLVGINCAVFLLMLLNGVPLLSPTTQQLVHWGADYGVYVLGGEWWRLVTATFVHVGLIHLGTNMWCLWNLGLLGEPLLGPVGMLVVYLLTGIAGNLLSTAVHPQIVGAGASGAVFGIAGALILLLKSPLLPVPQAELKRLRQSVIYFAVLNFVIGASTFILPSPIKIDNMAHLGGFLCGLLVGVPLLPRVGAPRPRFLRRQWITFSAATLLLLLFAYGISSYWHSVP